MTTTETNLTTFDLLTWAEGDSFAEIRQWPTFGKEAFHFNGPHMSEVLFALSKEGWKPIAVTERGWFRRHRVWTFTREVPCHVDGVLSGPCVVSRLLPAMRNP